MHHPHHSHISIHHTHRKIHVQRQIPNKESPRLGVGGVDGPDEPGREGSVGEAVEDGFRGEGHGGAGAIVNPQFVVERQKGVARGFGIRKNHQRVFGPSSGARIYFYVLCGEGEWVAKCVEK